MRADMQRLQGIFERLESAQTEPNYKATYDRLAAEAREACGDEPEEQEFLEALFPYTPTETGEAPLPRVWARLEARRRERDRTVPAA
jgi:hypothetical protein